MSPDPSVREAKLLSKKQANKETRKEIWSMMSDDLPDGAALAMAEEFDLAPEDLADD